MTKVYNGQKTQKNKIYFLKPKTKKNVKRKHMYDRKCWNMYNPRD